MIAPNMDKVWIFGVISFLAGALLVYTFIYLPLREFVRNELKWWIIRCQEEIDPRPDTEADYDD